MSDKVTYLDELNYNDYLPEEYEDVNRAAFIDALKTGVQNVTTDRQLLFLIEHYGNGLTQTEIAEKYHVNKSTVCRTLKRGLANCHKHISITK